ncbi:kinesin-like protein kif11 [Holotrichia oblita]|uniref:Kinesin-like protein kif11 n=1 Tax=Holotrichia oblita TaxID=644536 RepID=A0ACB9TAV2_HOLOL|nr:kinesin-like protein kif11 [Holotrichia oblita]
MAKQSSKEEQNINVFVRIRPNNPVENEAKTLEVLSKKEILSKTTYNQKRYVFDRVFDCHSSQQEIYNAVVSPLIPEVISGYNCTVFAYGQTGTGKTYTMEGFHDQDNQISSGIIPRALAQIFKVLSNMNTESSVKVSYLELYNEELFDLLSQCNTPKAIRIFEDKAQKGSVILQGLEELSVTELGQVYKILEQGSERRRIASTLMNSSSSRSHAVFTIVVHTREITVEGEELVKTGKLNLVDLAGSENISKSGAIDKRAREAGSINQSLLTLGRVIKALTEKNTHVPYRESKLTRILQDSLGGRTKTSLIATISSANVHMEETLNTLEYAMRARCIQNRPELNQKISRTALINQYSDTIEKLQRDLVAMRTGTGIFVDEDNYTKLITDHKAQKNEITEKMNYIKKLESDISDNTEKLQTLQASWVEAANNIEYLANEKKILEKDLVLVKEANEQHVRELKVVKDKHKYLKDETDKLLCDIQKHSVNEDTLHRKVSYLYQTSQSNKSIANSFYNVYNKLYTELISSVERCISFAMKAVLDTDALFKNQSRETTYGKIVSQINDLLRQSNEIREFKSKHIENKDMLGARFNTYFNSLQTLSQGMQERSIEFSTKFDDNLIYLRDIISSFSDEKGASLMTIMPNLFNIRQSAAREFMAMTDILKDFHCTIIANMDELINEVENLTDENKESHQVIETLQEVRAFI